MIVSALSSAGQWIKHLLDIITFYKHGFGSYSQINHHLTSRRRIGKGKPQRHKITQN